MLELPILILMSRNPNRKRDAHNARGSNKALTLFDWGREQLDRNMQHYKTSTSVLLAPAVNLSKQERFYQNRTIFTFFDIVILHI